MKVLSVCFIKLLIMLQVFALKAIEKDNLYAVPDRTMSDVLHIDTAINNKCTGDTLFSSDINEYWLYTSENPTEGQCLVHEDEESVTNSYFDKNKNTCVLIHGWTGDYENPLNKNMTRAVLCNDADNWNVICVDWSKRAKMEYSLASAAVRKIGEYICKFLKFLTTLGLCWEKIVLVGHSLGAHVAGFTGRFCDCKIKMIHGTDPARPEWETHPEKLSKNDACYVAVTHSSQFLGDHDHLMGHADFYPNGGQGVESCGNDFFCNHNMAPRYWCASWYCPDKFVAKKCRSIEDAEKDTCNGKEVIYGGCNMDNQPKGIFRFNIEGDPFMVIESESESECC